MNRSASTNAYVLAALGFVWAAVILAVAVNIISPWVGDALKERFVLPGVAAGLVLLALVTLHFWRAKRADDAKARETALYGQFRFVRQGDELTPADFGFVRPEPGIAFGTRRPYYDRYISRRLVPYAERDQGQFSREYDERALRAALRERRSILVVGSPIEGKTRLLFEVLSRLPDATIVGFDTEQNPSDDALGLLAGRRVGGLLR